MFDHEPFAALRITVAAPEQIRLWSHGEATRSDIIDCCSLQPEKDGLFCERIFGPIQDCTNCYGKHQRTNSPNFVYEAWTSGSLQFPFTESCNTPFYKIDYVQG